LIVYEHQPPSWSGRNVANKASLELPETKKYYELKLFFFLVIMNRFVRQVDFGLVYFFSAFFWFRGWTSSHKTVVT
jgi:hypothetical protein